MTAGHQGLSLIACCRHDDTIEEIALDDVTNDNVTNNDISITDGIDNDTKASLPLLSSLSTWKLVLLSGQRINLHYYFSTIIDFC